MSYRIEKIGNATLYLGNSLAILNELSPVFTGLIADPPYSSGGLFKGDRALSTQAKYAGNKKIHPNFSGDTRDQRSFSLWSSLWLEQCRNLCQPTSLAAIFSDWRQLPTTSDALQTGGWTWRGIGQWDKTLGCRPNMGGFRHQCEYFLWASHGAMNRQKQCQPGVFKAAPLSEKKYHLAGKPVALIETLLPLFGNNILDPFMGSGTVGVACEKRGIHYTGIEIDPDMFEVACQRIHNAHCEQQKVVM